MAGAGTGLGLSTVSILAHARDRSSMSRYASTPSTGIGVALSTRPRVNASTTNAAVMVLRIDDVIAAKSTKGKKKEETKSEFD